MVTSVTNDIICVAAKLDQALITHYKNVMMYADTVRCCIQLIFGQFIERAQHPWQGHALGKYCNPLQQSYHELDDLSGYCVSQTTLYHTFSFLVKRDSSFIHSYHLRCSTILVRMLYCRTYVDEVGSCWPS